MIEEVGVVRACDEQYAWIETQRRTTCGQCAARHGCGTAVLDKVLGRNLSRVRALNGAAARVGETVVVGLHERALVRGSAAVYLLPLLLMMAMAMVGELIAPQLMADGDELISIGFALVGLVLGFAWLRLFSTRVRINPAYQPIVLRRLETAMGTGSSDSTRSA